jgi:hypothetical protein
MQAHRERTTKFGLMARSELGKFHWLKEDSPFSSVVVNPNDRLFVHPYEKLVTVHRPDGQSTQLTLSQRDPVSELIPSCCMHFDIWPCQIWGLFMRARNDMILLLPEWSLAEQSPDIQDVYLRQYIWPKVFRAKLFSPLPVYLAQYRQMAIEGTLGTTSSDKEVLKRYQWFNEQDPNFEIPATHSECEDEFITLTNLKTYGLVSFRVRFHSETSDGMHDVERITTLTIGNGAIAIDNPDGVIPITIPWSQIKTLGVSECHLKFEFTDYDTWYIMSHLACEIGKNVRNLMTPIRLVPPVHQCHISLHPLDRFLPKVTLITAPKTRVTAEELLPPTLTKAIEVYTKLAQKRKKGQFDEEYTQNELLLNSLLARIGSLARKSSGLDAEFLKCTEQGPQILRQLNSPTPKTDSNMWFHQLEKEFQKMNKSLFGNVQGAVERQSFRENQTKLDSITTVASDPKPQKPKTVSHRNSKGSEPPIQQKAKKIAHLLAEMVDQDDDSDIVRQISSISSSFDPEEVTTQHDAELLQRHSPAALQVVIKEIRQNRENPGIKQEIIKSHIRETSRLMNSPKSLEGAIAEIEKAEQNALALVPVSPLRPAAAFHVPTSPRIIEETTTVELQTPSSPLCKAPDMQYLPTCYHHPQMQHQAQPQMQTQPQMQVQPGSPLQQYFGSSPLAKLQPSPPPQQQPQTAQTTPQQQVAVSPHIVVNVGDSKSPKKKQKRKSKHCKSESDDDSEGESDSESSYDSDSSTESESITDSLSLNEIIKKLEKSMELVKKQLNQGKPVKQTIKRVDELQHKLEQSPDRKTSTGKKLLTSLQKLTQLKHGSKSKTLKLISKISEILEESKGKKESKSEKTKKSKPSDIIRMPNMDCSLEGTLQGLKSSLALASQLRDVKL